MNAYENLILRDTFVFPHLPTEKKAERKHFVSNRHINLHYLLSFSVEHWVELFSYLYPMLFHR